MNTFLKAFPLAITLAVTASTGAFAGIEVDASHAQEATLVLITGQEAETLYNQLDVNEEQILRSTFKVGKNITCFKRPEGYKCQLFVKSDGQVDGDGPARKPNPSMTGHN